MDRQEIQVVVVDVNMRFWSMVFFMVKWAFASIPALIILIVLWGVLGAVFGGFHMGRHFFM